MTSGSDASQFRCMSVCCGVAGFTGNRNRTGLFICKPGIAVLLHIDRSAVNESVLFEQILHDIIVPVGIHAQMIALIECPFYAEASNTLYGSVAGYAVDHGVGTIVQPGAVLDDAVGRFDIPALLKEKGAHDSVFVHTDVAAAVRNIGADQVCGRPVRGSPLMGVIMLCHEAAGMFVYFHDSI